MPWSPTGSCMEPTRIHRLAATRGIRWSSTTRIVKPLPSTYSWTWRGWEGDWRAIAGTGRAADGGAADLRAVGDAKAANCADEEDDEQGSHGL